MFLEDREPFRSSLLSCVQCLKAGAEWTIKLPRDMMSPVSSSLGCPQHCSLFEAKLIPGKNETAISPINWCVFFFLISRFLVCYLTLSVRYLTNIDRRRYCNSMAVRGFLLCFASYALVPGLTNFLIQQFCLYFFLILITSFLLCSLISTEQMKR